MKIFVFIFDRDTKVYELPQIEFTLFWLRNIFKINITYHEEWQRNIKLRKTLRIRLTSVTSDRHCYCDNKTLHHLLFCTFFQSQVENEDIVLR